MNIIPSAHDFIAANTHKSSEELLIEFAKLHVQACKKEIAEKAEVIEGWNTGFSGSAASVDKNSILSSYPLDKII